MDCKKTRELLSEYIDGRLAVDEAAALAAHLEECGECRDLERELRATVALVGDLERREAPEGFAEGVGAALERRMLLEGGAEGARSGWAAWSFAGVSLAAAAVVLAVVLVSGPPDEARPPAEGDTSVAVREDKIVEAVERQAAGDTGAFTIERVRETAGEGGEEELPREAPDSITSAEEGQEAAGEEKGAAGASHLSYRRRATAGDTDVAGSGEPRAARKESETAAQVKVGADLSLADEAGAGRVSRDVGVEDRAQSQKRADESAAEAAAVETRAKVAAAGDAAASPVEAAEAPSDEPSEAARGIPRIEFYSEKSAVEATVLFANNFLPPESRMAPAKWSRDELLKRLKSLNFQVIELSDTRSVLQGEMEPAAILSNNSELVRNGGLRQVADTPREITSQVSGEIQEAIARQAPVSHTASGKPVTVRYVFVQRARPAEKPAVSDEAPAAE